MGTATEMENILQNELNKLLIESIDVLGIEKNQEDQLIANKFQLYMQNLLEYNSHTNLTAITEPKEVYIKHFVDSISSILSLEYLKKRYGVDYEKKRFIDVGTGAGFPAVPVKILCPMIDLTLLDSLEKRTRFLTQLSEQLELSNVTILHQRAEDAARQKDKRESYDIVLSRAVANLPVLLEYCLPFIRKGGYMVCLKGPSIDEELAKSKKALKLLGGELVEVLSVAIPFSELDHKIAIFRKIKNTDGKYPRKAGKPSKEPLV
ncbi:MAG: 16S rRNA (guanine(527)-N(7))-methyltransferase RsmG [Peptostreptococcaceae bacterium]|nr:16S rRNA (guanine(527)-N(7))-methyltransferase RsmG [Peptostreptococcaceae bacterium]